MGLDALHVDDEHVTRLGTFYVDGAGGGIASASTRVAEPSELVSKILRDLVRIGPSVHLGLHLEDLARTHRHGRRILGARFEVQGLSRLALHVRIFLRR